MFDLIHRALQPSLQLLWGKPKQPLYYMAAFQDHGENRESGAYF